MLVPHQHTKTDYYIRINGEPVRFPMSVDREALDEWAKLCEENPGCYVDIVSVHTEILVNQANYHQLKKHFGVK